MKKKTLIGIFAFLILVNLPIWKSFLGENFVYKNIDNTYRFEEITGNGGSFASVMQNYGRFLATHPEKDQGDNRLYRTFTIKPWKFWLWHEYIFHSDRFSLPYLATNDDS